VYESQVELNQPNYIPAGDGMKVMALRGPYTST